MDAPTDEPDEPDGFRWYELLAGCLVVAGFWAGVGGLVLWLLLPPSR